MDTNSNSIFIKELRLKTGLSQTNFGKKIGVSLRTIQNWESGKKNIPEWVIKNLESLSKNINRLKNNEGSFKLTDDIINVIESAILSSKQELVDRSDIVRDWIESEKIASRIAIVNKLKEEGKLK